MQVKCNRTKNTGVMIKMNLWDSTNEVPSISFLGLNVISLQQTLFWTLIQRTYTRRIEVPRLVACANAHKFFSKRGWVGGGGGENIDRNLMNMLEGNNSDFNECPKR